MLLVPARYQAIVQVRGEGVLEVRRAGHSWEYLGGQSEEQQTGQSHAIGGLSVLKRQGSHISKQASFLLNKLAFVFWASAAFREV